MNKDLKLMLSILKEVEKGNIPKAQDYGIETNEFCKVVDMAQDAGYIKGAKFSRGGRGNKYITDFLDNVTVTKAGIDFLKSNSTSFKLYREIKDWLKIIKS